MTRIQQKLLSGETPQLGAANLQEIVKRLSEKNGIGVRSFRILEPKEINVYLKISIHIDFNPVNSMLSLSQFIYDIEHHEKELMISEMDLLVMNPRIPNNIQGSLIITGVMKKAKPKKKEAWVMSSKYGFLSFLVLGLLLLLIFKNYEVWTKPIELVPEKNVGKKSQSKPQNKPEVPSTMGAQKDPASLKSYISIAAKNIFSPERKDFPIPMGDGKKELVRPQIVLYGVTIVGEYRAASIANPGRPLRKGERETFTVRAGERIGDYKLAKILSDRITLEAQGDTFEVLLYDSKLPKRRMDVKTEGRPATVTSTQPVPASPPGNAPACRTGSGINGQTCSICGTNSSSTDSSTKAHSTNQKGKNDVLSGRRDSGYARNSGRPSHSGAHTRRRGRLKGDNRK